MKRVVWVIALWASCTRAALAAPVCVGDCRSSGAVSVADLLTGVEIALGEAGADRCESLDGNASGSVTIDEVVQAVNNAVNGCPAFPGEYFATVTLDDGQAATMALAVAESGLASATVTIFEVEALVAEEVPGGTGGAAGVLHSLELTGTVNLDTGEYSLSGSYLDPVLGTVPVSVEGTLPLPHRGGGSVTFTLGQGSYPGSIVPGEGPSPTPASTATPTATPTRTSAPATATATKGVPTPAPGCGGGFAVLQFSAVSPDVNANQPLTSLEVTKGDGNITNMNSVNMHTFGGALAKCPVEVYGVSRVAKFSFTLFGASIVPGTTVELGKSQTLLEYYEATAAPSNQGWKATSGTLTIDAIDGNQVTFRVTNARMEPGLPFIFGPPAAGSFTLNFTGVVQVAINNV